MSTSAPDDQAASAATSEDDAASTEEATGAGAASTDDAASAEEADRAERLNAQQILRELASSIALLPQEGPPEGGEEPPEGAIALPVIEQGGTQYIPVFTSEEALRAAGADPVTALRLPLAELAASWPAEDLWLAVNPSSEEGLTLPPEVVRALPGFVQDPGDGGEDDAGKPDAG
jgi:hypothetical protein